jgi:hypothetical protein
MQKKVSDVDSISKQVDLLLVIFKCQSRFGCPYLISYQLVKFRHSRRIQHKKKCVIPTNAPTFTTIITFTERIPIHYHSWDFMGAVLLSLYSSTLTITHISGMMRLKSLLADHKISVANNHCYYQQGRG